MAESAKDRICNDLPWGVAHPGYGQAADDSKAWVRTAKLLKHKGSAEKIALENVPAVCDYSLYRTFSKKGGGTWDRAWSFGGTPQDMAKLLAELGDGWRCLIDFTHLRVTVNQANGAYKSILAECVSLEQTIQKYLELPHWPICHFSGIPPESRLIDSHDFLEAPVLEPIREGLRQMKVVCLEVPFTKDTSRKLLDCFRQQYCR